MGWFSNAVDSMNDANNNSDKSNNTSIGSLIKAQMAAIPETAQQPSTSNGRGVVMQAPIQPLSSESAPLDLPQTYDELTAAQQQLTSKLQALALVLHDQSSPEVRELMSQLQYEKTKQETLIEQAQQKLAQIKPKLETMDRGAEAILLHAISQQAWYAFRNKREILFDSRTGLLFPNFEYVSNVKCIDWKREQKKYAPSGVGQQLWIPLHEFISNASGDSTKEILKKNYYCDSEKVSFFMEDDYMDDYFPVKYAGVFCREMIVFIDDNVNYPVKVLKNFSSKGDFARDMFSSTSDRYIFPVFPIFYHPDIQLDAIRITANEKAKLILDFFIAQDWIPIFEPFLEKPYDEDEDDYQKRLATKQKECDEYNRLFDAYYQRIQLERQLVAVEQRLAELPPPAPDNPFTAAFDYRQALQDQHYDLVYIGQSVWQYSLAVQSWMRFLLTQLDDISQHQQSLLSQAAQLSQSLSAKPLSSPHLSDTEQQLLQARHTDLQQRLDFGLVSVRSALFEMLQQAQSLQQQLQQAHQHPDSLSRLAQIEAQQRPSFALVAEHSATLCTQVLTKLEWLAQSLDFVHAVVQSEQQFTAHYLILLDKYQADLQQQGTDNSIEATDVAQWFAEWRQQQWVVQQQWQPLIQAGLDHVLPQSTVLDTLNTLQSYQQAIDQFYLTQRLGVHTTYAFQPNGHRQEKLEKEQKLSELRHQLMQSMEQIIFALPSSVEKIWLVRWVEVWQQGLLQEISNLLRHEQLIERDDIVQIMLDDMRKVQQQNLAACLQDAKSYSQALAVREKDVATLIFKMRKALMK